MISCSWKEDFGIECMTCGFQRSFVALFNGEFVDSFLLFPATIPILLLAVVVLVHLRLKLTNGARAIIGLFSICAVLIVVNFSIKVISLLS
jgi:hypothetical protein